MTELYGGTNYRTGARHNEYGGMPESEHRTGGHSVGKTVRGLPL